MKTNLTELVFILDKSGSMCGLEEQTICGFNRMIEEQKKLEGEVLVSTFLFSDEPVMIHSRLEIEKVPRLTLKNYQTDGCTALLDTVGKAIDHISTLHKNLSPEIRPNKTLFVITTDGEENASVFYTYKKIRSMINRQKTKYGWEFLFLASDIKVEENARRLGVPQNRAVSYDKLDQTEEIYCCLSSCVSDYRIHGALADDLSNSFKKKSKKKPN